MTGSVEGLFNYGPTLVICSPFSNQTFETSLIGLPIIGIGLLLGIISRFFEQVERHCSLVTFSRLWRIGWPSLTGMVQWPCPEVTS